MNLVIIKHYPWRSFINSNERFSKNARLICGIGKFNENHNERLTKTYLVWKKIYGDRRYCLFNERNT